MTIVEVVSLETGKAISRGLVESVAVRADSEAESISVEETSVGAFDAGFSGPGFAEEVAFGDNGGIDVDDTLTVLDDGSVVAGEAGSGGVVPGGAEIADGDADTFGVGVPSFGALGAGSVNPDGASDVGGGVDIGLFAFAVDDLVSFVALLTDAFLKIELLAFTLNLAADSVLIEIVVLRALDAGVLVPDSAAEVVIELSEERGVVELLLGELQLLRGGAYEKQDHQKEEVRLDHLRIIFASTIILN